SRFLSKSGRVEIGAVARAHGIRGEVVVHTHDPASTVLADAKVVYVGNEARDVARARGTPKGWIVQLAGIDDRDAADALRGRVVEVDREQLGLAPTDVLLCDLVGCDVRLADGTPYGKVVAIDTSGQDRLVIHDGNR